MQLMRKVKQVQNELITITANEQVLPMVGELKNLRLATEVHYLFKD